jgi:hypothetical protein
MIMFLRNPNKSDPYLNFNLSGKFFVLAQMTVYPGQQRVCTNEVATMTLFSETTSSQCDARL